MNNFEYCVPTRVIFGRDTQKRAGELIKEYGFRKVMIHYGGGSVKSGPKNIETTTPNIV